MNTVWIRVVYAAVIAVLVAFTTVFGIAMAAPGPKPPPDPGITFRQLSSDSSDSRSQNTLEQQIEGFYGDAAKFRSEYPDWQRNVFLSATGLGIFFVLIGLALPAVVNYLRLGLVGGGLLVFVYAFSIAMRDVPSVTPQGSNLLAFVGAGFPEQINFASRFARFAVSFTGLILALFLGLWRLTEWSTGRQRAVTRTMAPAPAMAAAGPGASQWGPPPPAAVPPPEAVPPPAAATPVAETTTTATETREAQPPGAASEWRRPEGQV